MENKVVLTGGGTGGHIYPALAIGRGIKQQYGERLSLHYIGSGRGLEKTLVNDPSIVFYEIDAGGFSGKRPSEKIAGLFQTGKGLFQALRILRSLRPSLIVGTGGYVTVPVLLAGRILRIPVALHEQNAFPGLANRLAGHFAREIFLTFDESAAYFKSKANLHLTGLPVRAGFLTDNPAAPAKEPVLLVTGGSQGAKVLNQVILEALGELVQRGWQVQLITGSGEYDQVMNALTEEAKGYMEQGLVRIEPYSQIMDQAMAGAKLVMGRAGASFLAELGVLGKPSILVPYPHAAADHQRHNALAVQQAGAARILEQDKLSKTALLTMLDDLNQEILDEMARASARLGRPDALQQIMSVLQKTIDGANQ